MIILIPAYEPDGKLTALLLSIRQRRPDQAIVIVDDGSGPAHAETFAEAAMLGCDVVTCDVNRGKGIALKTGFEYIADHYPCHDVVTADCDGQHRLVDIASVAAATAETRQDRTPVIVLGCRSFDGDVPFRSRFGNTMTRWAFKAATGGTLSDTQTGLRGYPAAILGWLTTIDGDRFEYELEVLLQAKRRSISLVEVPIETVYIEENKSSHFRPLHDSIRVYVPLVRFTASSLSSFAIDAVVFFAVIAATSNLFAAVVVARLISASANFAINRRFVFRSHGGHHAVRRCATRYAALAAGLMAANYAVLSALVNVGHAPLVAAKVLTEALMFAVSYRVQDSFVFEPEPIQAPAGHSDPARSSRPKVMSPDDSSTHTDNYEASAA